MTDLFKKITDSRGLLENLVSKIPGFSGYMNKEARRESDRLLRNTIANRYGEQLGRVRDLQTQLLTGAGIEFVDDLQDAAQRLTRFIDMVKTAAMGYGGLFDAVKVEEKQLEQLYAFDYTLLDNVSKVAAAVDTIEAGLSETSGLSASIRNLVKIVAECNDTYERRKEVLLA
jgi:hypothetical protein